MEDFFNEYNISNIFYTYFILDVPRDVIKIYSINKLFKKCIDNNQKYFKSLFYTPETNKELKESVNNYVKNNNSLNLPHISKWNTYKITNMDYLFYNQTWFNEDISKWNTSNVISMNCMFRCTNSFNQKLNWDVSNVTNMNHMFYYAFIFNQELNWDVSNVTNMNGMFYGAGLFNQELNWDVSNVTSMNYMFGFAKSFTTSMFLNSKGKLLQN